MTKLITILPHDHVATITLAKPLAAEVLLVIDFGLRWRYSEPKDGPARIVLADRHITSILAAAMSLAHWGAEGVGFTYERGGPILEMRERGILPWIDQ